MRDKNSDKLTIVLAVITKDLHNSELRKKFTFDKISFWLDKENETLEIGIDNVEDDLLSLINKDKDLLSRTKKLLKQIYRYTGPFKYSTYIPF